jgi:PAS domain S-box-containing protein
MKTTLINKKLWLVFFLFFILTVANFFVVRYFKSAQKTDGAIIDAAGRNRMLSQQLGFYAERAVRGNEAVKEALKDIITLHQVSFYALKDGGVAPEIADNRFLPPTIPTIMPVVQEAENLWLEYKKRGEIIVNEPAFVDGAPNITVSNALDFIEKNASEMLRRNNEMVRAYVKMNDGKQAQMDIVLFVLLMINVAVIGLGARFTLSIMKSEELKAKDEAFLESIGDGLTVIDEEREIVGMNKAAGELLGITPDECIGKRYDEVFFVKNEKGENISLDNQPMQIALTTGKKISTTTSSLATYYYARKDKTRFPVAITVTPVVINGRIIGAIDVFRDITKEKEIDRAKSEFVSLASHQLKTPATIVKLYTERLLRGRRGALTAGQKEYVNELRTANQRMIDLVGALLNVSRIELDAFSIKPVSLDIIELLENILKELGPAIKEKHLALKTNYHKPSHILAVDESLLRIVISNLISNAIRYTAVRGTIEVKSTEVPKGERIDTRIVKESSLVVSVADNGCGIPQNQQEKIFTKFFRADNARKEHTDGTGLGLYIVKSILDHADGEVWFSSKENEGTVFYIAIPLSGMKERAGIKLLRTSSEFS